MLISSSILWLVTLNNVQSNAKLVPLHFWLCQMQKFCIDQMKHVYIYNHTSQKYTSQSTIIAMIRAIGCKPRKEFTCVAQDRSNAIAISNTHKQGIYTKCMYICERDHATLHSTGLLDFVSLSSTASPSKQLSDPSLDILDAIPNVPVRELPHISKSVQSSNEVAVSWRQVP